MVEIGQRAVEIRLFPVGEAAVVERLGVVGREFDGAIEIGDRLVDAAPGETDSRAVVIDHGGGRAQPDRGIVVGDGVLMVVQARQDEGATHQGVEVGLHLDRPAEIGDRPRVGTERGMDAATVVKRRHVVGLDRERPRVVLQRAVDLTFVEPGVAAARIGKGIAGIERDGAVVVGDRALKVLERRPRCAAIVDRILEVGFLLEGEVVVLQGAHEVALGGPDAGAR